MRVDLDRPPVPPPGHPMMTTVEIADLLRLRQSAVNRALNGGWLAGDAVKTPSGWQWLVPRVAVAEHMASTWSGPGEW
jgi:hypothetical protein